MTEKKCTQCGEVKPLEAFDKDKNGPGGRTSRCKDCRRAYYEAHREETIARRRAYREAHREELAAKQRAFYKEHREELVARKRAFYKEHREEELKRYRERREMLGNAYIDRYQRVTKKYATRSGRWSEAEDSYLIASADRIVDDALALKRTFQSVKNRIRNLRARGVVLARDGVAA